MILIQLQNFVMLDGTGIMIEIMYVVIFSDVYT